MKDNIVYAASHCAEGGILIYRIDAEGQLHKLGCRRLEKPSYMCVEDGKMYVLQREPYLMQSGVRSFEIRADGGLSQSGGLMPTHGSVAAHIMVNKGRIYCANYLSGTSICLPDRIIAHNGSGPDPIRQSSSHPHCLCLSPEGTRIFIPDLGSDSIHVVTPDMEALDEISCAPGSGPRHLIFSRDGGTAYCVNELASSVTAYEYSGGRLIRPRSYSCLPRDFKGENSASALRLSDDGKLLYVSNRGHGSICAFRAEGTRLDLLGFYVLPGASLRDFNLCGDYIICGDDAGAEIAVFSVSRGFGSEPVCRTPAEHPWCILTAAL